MAEGGPKLGDSDFPVPEEDRLTNKLPPPPDANKIKRRQTNKGFAAIGISDFPSAPEQAPEPTPQAEPTPAPQPEPDEPTGPSIDTREIMPPQLAHIAVLDKDGQNIFDIPFSLNKDIIIGSDPVACDIFFPQSKYPFLKPEHMSFKVVSEGHGFSIVAKKIRGNFYQKREGDVGDLPGHNKEKEYQFEDGVTIELRAAGDQSADSENTNAITFNIHADQMTIPEVTEEGLRHQLNILFDAYKDRLKKHGQDKNTRRIHEKIDELYKEAQELGLSGIKADWITAKIEEAEQAENQKLAQMRQEEIARRVAEATEKRTRKIQKKLDSEEKAKRAEEKRKRQKQSDKICGENKYDTLIVEEDEDLKNVEIAFVKPAFSCRPASISREGKKFIHYVHPVLTDQYSLGSHKYCLVELKGNNPDENDVQDDVNGSLLPPPSLGTHRKQKPANVYDFMATFTQEKDGTFTMSIVDPRSNIGRTTLGARGQELEAANFPVTPGVDYHIGPYIFRLEGERYAYSNEAAYAPFTDLIEELLQQIENQDIATMEQDKAAHMQIVEMLESEEFLSAEQKSVIYQSVRTHYSQYMKDLWERVNTWSPDNPKPLSGELQTLFFLQSVSDNTVKGGPRTPNELQGFAAGTGPKRASMLPDPFVDDQEMAAWLRSATAEEHAQHHTVRYFDAYAHQEHGLVKRLEDAPLSARIVRSLRRFAKKKTFQMEFDEVEYSIAEWGAIEIARFIELEILPHDYLDTLLEQVRQQQEPELRKKPADVQNAYKLGYQRMEEYAAKVRNIMEMRRKIERLRNHNDDQLGLINELVASDFRMCDLFAVDELNQAKMDVDFNKLTPTSSISEYVVEFAKRISRRAFRNRVQKISVAKHHKEHDLIMELLGVEDEDAKATTSIQGGIISLLDLVADRKAFLANAGRGIEHGLEQICQDLNNWKDRIEEAEAQEQRQRNDAKQLQKVREILIDEHDSQLALAMKDAEEILTFMANEHAHGDADQLSRATELWSKVHDETVTSILAERFSVNFESKTLQLNQITGQSNLHHVKAVTKEFQENWEDIQGRFRKMAIRIATECATLCERGENAVVLSFLLEKFIDESDASYNDMQTSPDKLAEGKELQIERIRERKHREKIINKWKNWYEEMVQKPADDIDFLENAPDILAVGMSPLEEKVYFEYGRKLVLSKVGRLKELMEDNPKKEFYCKKVIEWICKGAENVGIDIPDF